MKSDRHIPHYVLETIRNPVEASTEDDDEHSRAALIDSLSLIAHAARDSLCHEVRGDFDKERKEPENEFDNLISLIGILSDDEISYEIAGCGESGRSDVNVE